MTDSLQLLIDRLNTPIGEMLVVADRDGNLRATDWTDHEARMRRLLLLQYGESGFRLEPTRSVHSPTDAMSRYFAGELDVIDSLLVETGGTPFQHKVWRALRNIPCGRTISYAQLAKRIGRPTAIRAVGHANGANPVSIVVPCHRVTYFLQQIRNSASNRTAVTFAITSDQNDTSFALKQGFSFVLEHPLSPESHNPHFASCLWNDHT